MSVRTKAIIAIVIAACLWGSAGVVVKLLLLELSPFVIIMYRFLGATFFLLPFVHVHKYSKSFWKALIPISLLNALNVLFIFLGLARTTATSGSIIGATTPLITLVLAHLLIGERSTKNKIFGIFIGLAGAIMIALLPVIETGTALQGDLIGNVFIFLSIVSWSLYAVFSRKLLSQKTYAPEDVAFANFLTCGVVALILALVRQEKLITEAMWTTQYGGLLLFATVGLTLVTFSLFSWAIQHISATAAAFKDYIQLAIGVLLASIVLHEPLSPLYFAGAGMVVLGVFIATGEKVYKKILGR